MHHTAERGGFPDAIAFTDRVSDGHTDASTDSLTGRFPHADRVTDDRPAQRAVGYGRVGPRRGNASLPFVRPRRNLDGADDPAGSRR